MDGHNSHMIVNFIVYYMKHVIDSFILFLHTLYLFQLFNVSMFVFLKYILAKETDAVFRHNFRHISRMDWISMFICVRFKILISKDTFVG